MTVHQIAFRLNDEIPYEQMVLELLNQYPYENHHQTAKALVSVFAKQGLTHPGSNPQAAQDFYQTPVIQEPVYIHQPVTPTPPLVEENYVGTPEPSLAGEGLGAIEIDFGAL